MKNLFLKSRILSLFFLFAGSLMTISLTAQNSGLQYCTITATGTGKTTGEVAALTIYNPSEKEVKGSIGSCIIPSDGNYQPYITMKVIPPIVVPAGGSIDLRLSGFCADITKPAATSKDTFKPFENWIKIDENATGQIPPFKTNINPDTNPELAGPYLLKAIEEISKAYDKLSKEGKISTPFSGSPEKEREAVIQQTFWIYTSELRQKPYTKEQFSTRTYEQYEEKSNISPITLPPDKKQQLDKGIDDFWNTFQAVGTEAKVLNTPSKPEDENMIKNISGPVQTTCACGECRLIEGQRIEIYLDKSAVRFAGDSIPWSTNQVLIERPEILSTCIPMECLPTKTYEIRTTITYKDKRHPSPPSVWKEYYYQMASPIMEHQGEMLIEFRFKCYCAGKYCAEGMTNRKVYFIEKNDCCDKIRANNNGLLQFNFKGGNAKISGQKFSVTSPECGNQDFNFGFNLEAIFCNLTNDQVFSEFISLAQSKLSSGNLSEFYSSQSTSMGGVSTDPNMSKFYGFGFSKTVNEKEMTIFISVDKEKCAFDLSLICGDKVYEHTAPPYLSPARLQSMTYALNNPGQQQYWVNAMLILSHLARAQDHNMDKKYQQAFYTILGAISTQANSMITNPKYAVMNKQLIELAAAVKQALSKDSFSEISNVMQKIMPVVNFLGK